MSDDYGPNKPVQAKTSNQRPHRRPASAAARLGSHPGEALAQSMDAHDTQQLSITDTYDVDLEYHDIMLKALRSYTQHRHIEQRGGGGSKARAVGNMQKLKTRVQNLQNLLSQPSSVVETEGELRCILDNNGVLDENGNNLSEDTFLDHSDPPKTFKLAQCRLQYHDEEAWAERRKSLNSNSKTTEHKPVSRAPPGTVLLYPPATSDGIKADSSGHVFRPPPSKREQKRPWTALPCKFSDYITRSPNLSHQYSALSENNQRNPRRQHSDVTEKHSSIPNTDKDKEVRGHPNESSKLNVLTLRLRAAKMSGQPIPRSVAYQRRNQTTHSWYDTGHMMSQSLPSGGFLHRQYTSSASSTPRSSRDATSEKGSPVVKSASARPSSSYSYDGGFFVGAHAGQAEYFVIHPDWVSEAMTIKKLSIGSKKGPSGAGAHMPKARARSWQGRRCMSAPPSKLRNPITWDHSDPVDIPRPKKK
ncbi:uncharacterized protein LOC106014103 [Aplysia californica]|nr:uncharacterized protein LOC106014103 [Aplysia californica]